MNRELVRETGYTDRGLAPGVEYTYKVSAIGALGNESVLSGVASATAGDTGTGPTAPDGTPGAGVYQEGNANLVYNGSWPDWWDGNFSGSNQKYTDQEGSTASLTFNGTGVKWVALKRSYGGEAEVQVDGKLEAVVNLWSSNYQYQQVVFQKTHMAPGLHTIEIKALRGQIYIDALNVLGEVDNTAAATPAAIGVSKGNTIANLQWDSNTDTDLVGYRLYRSASIDGGFVPLSSYPLKVIPKSVTGAVYYTDSSLVNGETYYYTVTSVDEAGNESAPATPVSVIPQAGAGKHEENNPGIVYTGSWSTSGWDSSNSGNYNKYTDTVGNSAFLSFEGRGVRWVGWTNTNGGQVEVTVKKHDQAGEVVEVIETKTVDLWSSSAVAQVELYLVMGLARGHYSIEIKNTSTGSSKRVWLDYLEVLDSDDVTPPAVPAVLTTVPGNRVVELQWSRVADADLYGYMVYRSLTSGGPFEQLNPRTVTGKTTWVDSTVDNGTNYYYQVTAVDQVGNESAGSAVVRALPAMYPGKYEEGNSGLSYQGSWSNWGWDGNHSEGYVKQSNTVGSTVTMAVYGTGVKWVAAQRTIGGIASVTLDGGEPEEVNLLNSGGNLYQQTVYEKTSLAEGLHTLVIEVKSGYTYLDAIEVTGTTEERGRVEEDSLAVEYSGVYSGFWDLSNESRYSNGQMRQTRRAGAVATYTFYGTGIEWLAYVDANRGIAKVTLDDEDPVLVDLYSGTEYQKRVYKRHGLELGIHTLNIEVTGTKSATSNDNWVDIDAFEVLSPVTEVLGAPTGLTAATANGSVTLNWTAPGPEVVGYRIYRYRGILDDGIVNRELVRETGYTDRGLAPGVEYTYKVSAIGA
ncbi:MAG: fibronectin type III domain-containing protein, partial [Bellilinea sp.]